MSEIPTIEKHFHQEFMGCEYTQEELFEWCKSIIKLHVKAALENAKKQVTLIDLEECHDFDDSTMYKDDRGNIVAIDKDSILNSYSESNIK